MDFNSRVWEVVEERLTEFSLDAETGCHVWQGDVHNRYGRITVVLTLEFRAHRAAYEVANGEIPQGLVLHHTCRNKLCINPEHLEMMTPSENSKIEGRLRMSRSHCRNGHEFTPGNTRNYTQRRKGGRVYQSRECRECRNAITERTKTRSKRVSAEKYALLGLHPRQHAAKLTRDQAVDIVKRCREGEDWRAVAVSYAMSYACVYDIMHRNTWKRLPGSLFE